MHLFVSVSRSVSPPQALLIFPEPRIPSFQDANTPLVSEADPPDSVRQMMAITEYEVKPLNR